jgi:GNAT superfamily N-acetyltransferase
MTADIRFRQATKADLPGILALYANSLDGEALPVDEAEPLFERLENTPGYRLYVAEVDGELAGSFALLIMTNLGHCGTPSGIVEDVVVAPGRQRSGVGRAMMEHAMQLCRDCGCYKLALSSNLRRTDAHAFYESLGFEKHGFSFRVDLDEFFGRGDAEGAKVD